MIHGVILNSSWIWTGISMSIVAIASIVFYVTAMNFYDLTTFSVIIMLVLILVYSSYFCEKKLKEQFISLHQIKLMNSELTKLFDSLPEGIVLFNQDTQKIALANTEFKRLFSVGQSDIF
jgi:sensor histidine kinase regulating citrate/malate metabolism